MGEMGEASLGGPGVRGELGGVFADGGLRRGEKSIIAGVQESVVDEREYLPM